VSRARFKRSGFDEVALDRKSGCDDFPFALARQPCAGPAGVGIRFEQAYVAHGSAGLYRAKSVQAEFEPAASVALPIKRRIDRARRQPVPTFGEPQFRTSVPRVVDEGEIFTIGHLAARERKSVEVLPMTRRLVVECELAGVVTGVDNA